MIIIIIIIQYSRKLSDANQRTKYQQEPLRFAQRWLISFDKYLDRYLLGTSNTICMFIFARRVGTIFGCFIFVRLLVMCVLCKWDGWVCGELFDLPMTMAV